jgi:putative ABC transport system permease protein
MRWVQCLAVNDKGTLAAEEEDFFTLAMIQELTDTYQSEILAISASESVGSGQILDGDAYANVTVTGVSMGYFVANENNLLAGRYFTDAETS